MKGNFYFFESFIFKIVDNDKDGIPDGPPSTGSNNKNNEKGVYHTDATSDGTFKTHIVFKKKFMEPTNCTNTARICKYSKVNIHKRNKSNGVITYPKINDTDPFYLYIDGKNMSDYPLKGN